MFPSRSPTCRRLACVSFAKSYLSPSSPPRTNGPKGSDTGSAHSHGALVCFSCSDKLINQLRTGAPLGPGASDFMRARREMFEVAENEKGLDSELQSLQTSMVLLQTVVVVVIIFDFACYVCRRWSANALF